MNNDILALKNLLRKCYSIDTVYPGSLNDYDKHDISYGHCAIATLICYERFGGKIGKIKIDDISHYFNIIDNNIIDLTKEQFEYEVNYSNYIIKDYNDILNNSDTKNRYLMLKLKLLLLDVDSDISKCNLCLDMVEHFPSSKTVSIGKNRNIVILGEAPANNGWRKSGIAWYDVNKKLLPSGVVMQKLLDILDIKLDDTLFLEAIKCYPKNRKYLNKCGNNCRKYLLRQLDIINPKVVLVLGDAAFKTILDVKYKKFSEVVGREFMLDNIKIIPIYHPSPISPLSLKGNIPIFEKLKEEL